MISRRKIIDKHQRGAQRAERPFAPAAPPAGEPRQRQARERIGPPESDFEQFERREEQIYEATNAKRTTLESEPAARKRPLDAKSNKHFKSAQLMGQANRHHKNLLDDALSFDRRPNGSGLLGGQARGGQPELAAGAKVESGAKLRAGHTRDDESFLDAQQVEEELASGARPSGRQTRPYEENRNFDPYSVYGEEDEEEDVWYSEERLFEDHIQEIVDKWRSIDDEIWAKIICMERNRRIAKAYARKQEIMVDGSRDDYLDGATLGLNSFENPERDSKTSYLKQHIGEGVKLKIHQNGDIFVKRLSKASVFVHQFKFSTSGPGGALFERNQLKGSQSSSDVYALHSEAGGDFYDLVGPRGEQMNTGAPLNRFNKLLEQSKSSSGASSQSPTSSSCASSSSSSNLTVAGNHMDKPNALQPNRLVRIFNMAKFMEVLDYESQQASPNRVRLHSMCISIINFVYDDQKMLNLPSWIMVINIVAIDLLSSKIGLVGPYDMSALESSGTPMPGYRLRGAQFNMLARNKPFEQLSSANDYDQCHFDAPEDEPYRKFNGFATKNKQRLKKSSDDNESQFIMLRNRHPLGACQAERRQDATGGGDASNSIQYYEGRPALLQATRSEGELKALGASYNTREIGSSSSGIDSNCSYQNATPATSSSSIDLPNNALERDRQAVFGKDQPAHVDSKRVFKLGRFFKGGEPSKPSENTSRHDLPSSSNSLSNGLKEASSKANIRGKRPPKLPHGISSKTLQSDAQEPDEPSTMSEPIPIPAPPTSAGGPSGKANLILVSPTGLSPPSTAKRINATDYLGAQSDNLLARQFDTIKHIDEEGKCAVILEQDARQRGKLAKMPTGIPSHAQLAPPATQRHILRYLMSTARSMGNHAPPSRPNDETRSGNQTLHPEPPVPPGRPLRRPLPILPPAYRSSAPTESKGQALIQPRKPQAPDESLYYSGLQARVPKFYHPQRAAVPIHPITKGAIDAILSDFKQNAHFRQHQQQHKLNQIRHEQLLLAKMRSNSDAQLRLMSDLVNGHPEYASNRTANSKDSRKVSNVFPVGHNQSYLRSLESLNRTGGANSSGGSPLASLLIHMGGFLRRSKAKKSDMLEVK